MSAKIAACHPDRKHKALGLCDNCYKVIKSIGDPERHRRNHLKRRYGISITDYNILLEQQGGVRAICKSSPGRRALSVDHDHQTLEIRGLLCESCNLGIGHFQDDIDLLNIAIKYLGGEK